jgi:6-pyruvoyltetrahydropterin/6-carboxytetrahydropterin synthase
MRVRLTKSFRFEAAHDLPTFPPDHKCRRLHGHSFRIGVYVSGACDRKSGWVMDFADITEKFQPLFERLDHYCLNEVQGLENPTSENLARWVWMRLAPEIPGLARIVIRETCNAGCVYRGEAEQSDT